MKIIYSIIILALLFASCSPSNDNSGNTKTPNGVPKLIVETNGWHVLGGQRVPLSVGEFPMCLQYENGHLTQSYNGMFYANPNNITYDFARCNMKGDSIFCRQTSFEYNPFFYKEGDATDVRYGVFWQQSPRSTVNLSGIGPASDDTNTTLHTFTSSRYNFKFANPNLFMYYDGSIAGIKAYRIGTGQTINLYNSAQTTTFSDLSFKGTLDIDETYCKVNPTHLKAYYASNFPGTSYNGHSPNYISIYSIDDVNKTVFRDSTSVYREQATGYTYKVSCNDANNVYFFFGGHTLATNTTNSNDFNTLMLVYNKTTQKIARKKLLSQLAYATSAVVIPSKNQLFLTTLNSIFKIDLANDTITNVTPQLASGGITNYAIATDGNRLYATVGSSYTPGKPATTNVIYFE
jgi:hypothetical protein